MDLEVEIGAWDAEDVGAQQVFPAATRQHGIQVIEQITILAAQIQEAARRADRIGGHGHAFEDQIGIFGEQHAVLESPRLALVGIADEDAL